MNGKIVHYPGRNLRRLPKRRPSPWSRRQKRTCRLALYRLLLSADKDKPVSSIAVQRSAAELLGSSIIKRNPIHCLCSEAAAGFSMECDGDHVSLTMSDLPPLPRRYGLWISSYPFPGLSCFPLSSLKSRVILAHTLVPNQHHLSLTSLLGNTPERIRTVGSECRHSWTMRK